MTIPPPKRAYDAVAFDLLTASLDLWSAWNRAAGSEEDGRRVWAARSRWW